MQPFVPHLSHHIAPLRAMLQKNDIFNWTPSANAALQKLKSQLVEALENSLKYFDRNLPVTVQMDVSLEGIGPVLVQQGQPIAFTFKCLSDTERRYANIGRNS